MTHLPNPQLIQDGEPVRGGVANRAPLQLDANIRQLLALFEAAMLGETVFARGQTVETDAQVGMPVYYNGATQQFERAVGGAELDESLGALRMTTASQVWGVVYAKTNATKADILLFGTADLDLSAAVDATIELGALYYLSNSSPGKLITTRQPVGVAVLQVSQEGATPGTHKVFVNTKFYDLLEAHRHYRFVLQAVPAGDHAPPSVGNRHVITNPDPDVEGWLPADHAAFNGLAPPGAAFGYNIAQSSLAQLWPPVPIQSVHLEWSKGEDKDLLGMGVPLGSDQLCVIDRHGIWWMSDCYGDVPWPTSFNGAESISDSASVIECPRLLFPQLVLWFSRPVFANTATWVSSLRAAENSGLSITCLDTGEPATTGHLLLDLVLSLIQQDASLAGYQVVKELTDDGKLRRGPVVESLKPATANVQITGDLYDSATGRYYGNLLISVDQDIDGRELAVDTVRLEGVEEEYYKDVIGLGFPADRLAEFRGRVNIPAGLALSAGTQIKLRFWFLNRSSSNVPADLFSVSYRRIALPGAAGTPVALPTAANEVALGDYPGSAVTISAIDQYFYLETDPFEIAAGDVVLFTLQRDGAADALNSDLHLIRQKAVYVIP